MAACGLLLALAALPAGCKKRLDDPDDQGRLTRIAARLDEAYAHAPLPPLREPERLAERLAKWDDFRSCTVKTYVARKRAADARARDGDTRPSRHGSIGEETVEECAVQAAIANKDPSLCERLSIDYAGPSHETPLSAVRCWDTRARIFGLPEECPVVWQADDAPGRNPECLAVARRDPSFCPFAESPGRCRALVAGDPASCSGSDAAPDCVPAVTYWGGIIPPGISPPLVVSPKVKEGEKPFYTTFDLTWPKHEQPQMHIEGPRRSTGISWPQGRSTSGPTENTAVFWGAQMPPAAAQITWKGGQPALKLAFVPAGSPTGVRTFSAAGPGAGATVVVTWPDPRAFRRCSPGPNTTGQITYDAGNAAPGSLVTGTAEATRLACTDGSEINLQAKFRLVILEVR